MEIDFLYYMKILATFTLTFIAYRLLVIEKKDKTKDHYSRPGNCLFFCVLDFFLTTLIGESSGSLIKIEEFFDFLRNSLDFKDYYFGLKVKF